MTPEQKAIVSIDALLAAAGWHVCNVSSANLHAATGISIREFSLNNLRLPGLDRFESGQINSIKFLKQLLDIAKETQQVEKACRYIRQYY